MNRSGIANSIVKLTGFNCRQTCVPSRVNSIDNAHCGSELFGHHSPAEFDGYQPSQTALQRSIGIQRHFRQNRTFVCVCSVWFIRVDWVSKYIRIGRFVLWLKFDYLKIQYGLISEIFYTYIEFIRMLLTLNLIKVLSQNTIPVYVLDCIVWIANRN